MAGIHNSVIGTAQTFGPVGYVLQIITVGGGGGGGFGQLNNGLSYYTIGGGGSAGQVLSQTLVAHPGDTGITFTIGAGGAGGDPTTYTPGSAGTFTTASNVPINNTGPGGNGADVYNASTEGGGGAGGDTYSGGTGAYNSYTGFLGGNGDLGISFGWPGGGGGGAGAVNNGSAGTTTSGGDGGSPASLDLWYDIYTPIIMGRGGGGGAGGDDSVNPGPNVGGNFGYANQGGWWDAAFGSSSTNGGNATQYGDGGGGGTSYPGFNTGSGGNGYQGVAIVKYLGPQQGTGGDSIWTAYGYTYHLFFTSGTFNP